MISDDATVPSARRPLGDVVADVVATTTRER